MQKNKSVFTVRRLALDAVLIALYVILGFWKIPVGNLLRVNLASFAVVVCAVAFSPLDALVVGFMGEFLSQVLGPYGLTPTTVLWAAPEAVRGLMLGATMLLFRKKGLYPDRLMKDKAVVLFIAFCAISGMIASCVNTFAFAVVFAQKSQDVEYLTVVPACRLLLYLSNGVEIVLLEGLHQLHIVWKWNTLSALQPP